ncbi:MAG: PTS IIA-like nitrogen regulatory protein PtsN [Thiohalocapsa sp.]
MLPSNLINEARILNKCDVTSKKRLLETLAELLAKARPDLLPDSIFERLLERERLGSTGLGYGMALPHARVDDITIPVGAFVQLESGVDFDAIDDQPVDLAFALLVPQAADEHHLQLLASLAEMFNQPTLRQQLREGNSESELFDALTGWAATADT